jgi:sugar-specific transcriptional regulator TrmB
VDLLGQLTRIGLSDDEAKVYLSLWRDNPATGYQIAKETEAPRSQVQEILSRLHDRGIVLETLEGRATLYRPLPPLMLLAQHEADHSRLLAELSANLDDVYKDTRDDRIWSIEGRVPALTYAAKMIQYAETEIYLVLNDRDLRSLRPEIEAACARDLSLNALLTGEGELRCGRVAYHPPLESEPQHLGATLLVVVEGAEVLISSKSPLEEMRATITRNNDVGNISRQLVWMELFT